MEEKKLLKKTLGYLLSASLVLSSFLPNVVEAGSVNLTKSSSAYGSSSTSGSYSDTFNTASLSRFRAVTSMTTNNGTISYAQSGAFTSTGTNFTYDYNRVVSGSYTPSDTIYVTAQTGSYYNSGGYSGNLSSYVYSGSYTPATSTYVTNQTSSYYNSGGYYGSLSSFVYSGYYTPSDSMYVSGQTSSYYSSGGYYGSLSSYVYSGSYTPSDSRGVTVYGSYWGYGQTCPSSGISTKSIYEDMPSSSPYYYNSEGYSGTLPWGYDSGLSHPSDGEYCAVSKKSMKKYRAQVRWSGTATKPAVDTRVYRYSGTVYKDAVDTRTYRYQGTVYKDAVDTRTYRYQGYVTKPAVDTRQYDKLYAYTISMNYETHENPVVASVTAVKQDEPSKIVNISGAITDGNATDNSFSINIQLKNSAGTVVKQKTASVGRSFAQTIDVSDAPTGAYTIAITATDPYGYVSSSAQSGLFQIDNNPKIDFKTSYNGNTLSTSEKQVLAKDSKIKLYFTTRDFTTFEYSVYAVKAGQQQSTGTYIDLNEKGAFSNSTSSQYIGVSLDEAKVKKGDIVYVKIKATNAVTNNETNESVRILINDTGNSITNLSDTNIPSALLN